jgi:hypothetical protein
MRQFSDMAREHFGLLASAHGLKLVKNTANWLEYRSDNVLLLVAYDSIRTREVAVNIATFHDKKDPYYGFSFDLYLILLFHGAPEMIEGGTLSLDELDRDLKYRARLVAKYCGQLLDGNVTEFKKLEEYCTKASHEYELRNQLQSAQARAEMAWNNRDFGRVIKELGPHELELDKNWQDKLEIAREKQGRN